MSSLYQPRDLGRLSVVAEHHMQEYDVVEALAGGGEREPKVVQRAFGLRRDACKQATAVAGILRDECQPADCRAD